MSLVPALVGAIYKFEGTVDSVEDISRTHCVLKCKSKINQLNTNIPKNTVNSYCLNNLYDVNCKVAKASYKETLSVLTNSTQTTIYCTSTQVTGYYQFGEIVFTSGNNNAVTRTIKSHIQSSGSTLVLETPLPYAVQVGDTFDVYAGCPLTRDICESRFNNLDNIRIFPYVPIPESTIL